MKSKSLLKKMLAGMMLNLRDRLLSACAREG